MVDWYIFKHFHHLYSFKLFLSTHLILVCTRVFSPAPADLYCISLQSHLSRLPSTFSILSPRAHHSVLCKRNGSRSLLPDLLAEKTFLSLFYHVGPENTSGPTAGLLYITLKEPTFKVNYTEKQVEEREKKHTLSQPLLKRASGETWRHVLQIVTQIAISSAKTTLFFDTATTSFFFLGAWDQCVYLTTLLTTKGDLLRF